MEAEEAMGAAPEDGQEKADAVAMGFEQAREQLSRMLDDKFREIQNQLQKSFGNVGKIDSVTREKFAQTLIAIAQRLRSMGGQEGPPAPSTRAAVEHHLSKIDELLVESELLLENEDAHGMKIRGVGEYLNTAKQQIMASVDQILQTLQRDTLHQTMTGLASQFGGMTGQLGDLQTRMGDLHKAITSPPLNPKEKEAIADGLAQLGRALNISKRKFGGKATGDTAIKIFAGPRKPVSFDPTDPMSIRTIIQKLEDPRNTRVVIDGKQYMVNLTDDQDIANLVTMIQSRTEVAPPAPKRKQRVLKLRGGPAPDAGATMGAPQPTASPDPADIPPQA